MRIKLLWFLELHYDRKIINFFHEKSGRDIKFDRVPFVSFECQGISILFENVNAIFDTVIMISIELVKLELNHFQPPTCI